MTIETLEQYYGLCTRIEMIEDELKSLQPVKSPKIGGVMSTEPGDPTSHIAMTRISRKEQLDEFLDMASKLKQEVDEWKDNISDGEIAAIVYWHYIKRFNWKRTNLKVYGYPDYDYSRKKIYRYFQKLSELSE